MKKSFYLRYLEQQGITNKKNKVKKSDVEARESDFFMSKFRTIFKIIYYTFLSILVSIALTVIVNPSIREIFINLFKGGFSL